jgi:uncharacterized RDD family membrane protein YckC
MEQILDTPEVIIDSNVNYAGFWIRVGAAFIDALLVIALQVVFAIIIIGTPNIMLAGTSILLTLVNYIAGFLYQTLMDSSKYQGTLGKMAVGIKITGLNGERISYGKAVGRYFAKLLASIIFGIGLLMVAFDKKKQGLHDKMVKTYVVEK